MYGATLAPDRFGNINKAYNFDGVNDYIKAKADSLPTKERTISVWFKVSTMQNHPVVLGYGGGQCGEALFIDLNHGETPRSYHIESHCNYNDFSQPYTVDPVGSWYHWLITTSSVGTRMYINGVLILTNNVFINTTKVAGKDFAIGVCVSGAGYAPYTNSDIGYFTGVLDDIRFYNRSLTTIEIQQLYHEGGW